MVMEGDGDNLPIIGIPGRSDTCEGLLWLVREGDGDSSPIDCSIEVSGRFDIGTDRLP